MKQMTADDTARIDAITEEIDNEYSGIYLDTLAGETELDKHHIRRILRLKHLRAKIEMRYSETMADTMAILAGSARF